MPMNDIDHLQACAYALDQILGTEGGIEQYCPSYMGQPIGGGGPLGAGPLVPGFGEGDWLHRSQYPGQSGFAPDIATTMPMQFGGTEHDPHTGRFTGPGQGGPGGGGGPASPPPPPPGITTAGPGGHAPSPELNHPKGEGLLSQVGGVAKDFATGVGDWVANLGNMVPRDLINAQALTDLFRMSRQTGYDANGMPYYDPDQARDDSGKWTGGGGRGDTTGPHKDHLGPDPEEQDARNREFSSLVGELAPAMGLDPQTIDWGSSAAGRLLRAAEREQQRRSVAGGDPTRPMAGDDPWMHVPRSGGAQVLAPGAVVDNFSRYAETQHSPDNGQFVSGFRGRQSKPEDYPESGFDRRKSTTADNRNQLSGYPDTDRPRSQFGGSSDYNYGYAQMPYYDPSQARDDSGKWTGGGGGSGGGGFLDRIESFLDPLFGNERGQVSREAQREFEERKRREGGGGSHALEGPDPGWQRAIGALGKAPPPDDFSPMPAEPGPAPSQPGLPPPGSDPAWMTQSKPKKEDDGTRRKSGGEDESLIPWWAYPLAGGAVAGSFPQTWQFLDQLRNLMPFSRPPVHRAYSGDGTRMRWYGDRPSDDVPAAKARQILHDGEVHGHPLTDAQRGMFGAAAGR